MKEPQERKPFFRDLDPNDFHEIYRQLPHPDWGAFPEGVGFGDFVSQVATMMTTPDVFLYIAMHGGEKVGVFSVVVDRSIGASRVPSSLEVHAYWFHNIKGSVKFKCAVDFYKFLQSKNMQVPLISVYKKKDLKYAKALANKVNARLVSVEEEFFDDSDGYVYATGVH